MKQLLDSKVAVALATAVISMVIFGSGAAVALSVPNNSVNSAKIVDNTVRSADIRNNTVTNADMALGQRIYPINFRGGDVTNQPLLALNGMTLRVTCTGGGAEAITVLKTSTVDAEIAVISNDAEDTNATGDYLEGDYLDEFDNGDVFTLAVDSSNERMYDLAYSAANGRNVTASFITEDDLAGNGCVVSGYAVG